MSPSSRLYTEKYNVKFGNTQQIKANLQQYGVAVVTDVISPHECEENSTQFWDNLKHMSKGRFDINDKSSYVNYFETFLPAKGQILQHHSIGHLQSVWDIRQHENTAAVFRDLYDLNNSKELLTSFDGVGAHVVHPSRGTRIRSSFHLDETKKSKECFSVQGFVTLYDVRPGDATLCVLERSHLHYSEFMDGTSPSQYLKVTNTSFFDKRGCLETYIACPRGSLVLWDSRVVHKEVIPEKYTSNDTRRLVYYVSMKPRMGIKDIHLRKKRTALRKLRNTTHMAWPARLFSIEPRRYGNKYRPEIIPVRTQPVLTDLGKALAGF